MSKYKARKTELDGITFDSQAEANRYRNLALLQKAGLISDLELQVPYVLAPKAKLQGESRTRPAVRYVADFRYTDSMGQLVVEDVKGMDTPVSRLKRHLLKTVHGVDVRVIR